MYLLNYHYFINTTPEVASYFFLSPYQEDAEYYWTESIKATIPDTQNAVAGSYDPAAMICVGSGTSTEPILLNKACALIKIKVADGLDDVKSISLNSSYNLAGVF